MEKKSRRPKSEQIQGQGKERKKAWGELRRKQQAEGLEPLSKAAIPNRKSTYESVEEERNARQEAVSEQIRVFRSKLPVLLKRLSAIKDPRNPKKIKYHLTVLMIYGILSFVFQMASRREANREMTYPVFMENLKKFFPELYVDKLPHNDTPLRLMEPRNAPEMCFGLNSVWRGKWGKATIPTCNIMSMWWRPLWHFPVA